ncbi:MAG: MFS transporter, partial [Chthoniobacterales bacterium]
VGPMIAALGFALFTIPGVGGSYWQNFFPAIVVLGIGMAVSVAPLTTSVMNSVTQNRVGIASGVNNAIARAAGLLAIAALGIVMIHRFEQALNRQLANTLLPPPTRQSLQAQSIKLAAISVPENLDRATREIVDRAIDESFVRSFRLIMTIGASLAVAGAMIALALIRNPEKS